MSLMRCEEPGFEAVDVPDGRRGLWMRTAAASMRQVERLELAAGREGDDALVVLQAGETLTPELLGEVEDALSRLRYACEVAAENARSCPYCYEPGESFADGGGI